MTPEKVDFLESMSHSYNYDKDFITKDRFWIKAKKDFEELFLNPAIINPNYRIPKKIHQIWLGSNFPEEYLNWQESWKRHHPDWEYYLWTDAEVKQFEFRNREVFEETKNFGAKSDILRYEILYNHGGLYIDTDFECFHPFDYVHKVLDFYLGIMFGKEFSVTNCIIGSIPEHPILKLIIESINQPLKTNNVNDIHEITGPWAFSDAYKSLMFKDNHLNVAFPVTYFFPFPNNKLHIQNIKKIRGFKKKESLGLHYWEVSWVRHLNPIKKFTSKIFRYVPSNFKNKIKNTLFKPK